MTTERIENMAGGQGHVLIKRLLNEKQLNGKCGLYAEVTLEPGCSLGYHEHHNESETYYILSGKGIYSDNGTLRMVKAGAVKPVLTHRANRADFRSGCIPVWKAMVLW